MIIVNISTLLDEENSILFLESEVGQALRHKMILIYDLNHFDNKEVEALSNFYSSTPVLKSKLVKQLAEILNSNQNKLQKFKSPEAAQSVSIVQDKHILVAEDNLINQMIIKKVLMKFGFDVTIANNGLECVEAMKGEENFELIFMDIQMPEMDGIQATGVIRNELNLSEIPIVALTADVTVETKSKVIAHGMNDFLSKPLDLVELEKVINHWVKA